MGILRRGEFAAQWNVQEHYGAEVPGGTGQYMERAVGEIAAGYRNTLAQVLRPVQAQSPGVIPPEALQQIRVLVRARYVDEFPIAFNRRQR